MGISDLFVDPESLPEGFYGLCQLSTLLFGYGYVLYVASNMISDGSELLLLIPSLAGIVGSCVLPVLGAVPDGMIVFFSGMGPNAQEQLDVGVGALAGSTIMLITIPWVLSVYAGRVDIVEGKPRYTKEGKKAEGTSTGIPNSPGVRKGGLVMMLTASSYILLQGPAQYFESQGLDKTEVSAAERFFALIGLFVTLFLFVGYLYYQWALSLNDGDEVASKKKTEMIIKKIEGGQVTIRGALFKELLDVNEKQDAPSGNQGLGDQLLNAGAANGYSAVGASHQGKPPPPPAVEATSIWAQLPDTTKARFTAIIKSFWRKFVPKDARPQAVQVESLSKMFTAMGENLPPAELHALFDVFDADDNGMIDLEEFILGVTMYLWNHTTKHPDHVLSTMIDETHDSMGHGGGLNGGGGGGEDGEEEDDDEEEEKEMPEELADLSPEEQQSRLFQMSFTTMGLGTLLVIIFSDPMTDVLGEVGARTGVKPFYVSFVIAPLASNAAELIASYSYALKKTPKSISIALQALQGAACMNNTFCLSIFMALIYFQGLAWEYSAETIAIVLCQLGVAIVSAKPVQTMTTGMLVFSLYPACLALVALLEASGFD